MADAGCWSPDVLSNEEDRQTGLLTGKTAAMVWNMGTCLTYARQANTENPDWNTTLVDRYLTIPSMLIPTSTMALPSTKTVRIRNVP